MSTQVVLSRIQNRRGTQSQFDALYISGAPVEQQLQPGEIGLCTDTGRVFIGEGVGTYTEFITSGGSVTTGDTLEFTPLVVSLAPSATWFNVTSLSFSITVANNTCGLLNILYSLKEVTSNPTPFTKNGTLTITTTTSSIPLATVATLTDTGTEINSYVLPQPDISFKVEYTGGIVQVYYKHNFTGSTIQMSTASIRWVNF